MNSRSILAVTLGLILLLMIRPGRLAAQINIAAIAQFKYNQQHALAESLSKTQKPAEKQKHHKGDQAAVAAASRPAVIHARNPTFKSNYGDIHTKNVR